MKIHPGVKIEKFRMLNSKSSIFAVVLVLNLFQSAQALQWERVVGGESPGVRILDEDPPCWFSPVEYYLEDYEKVTLTIQYDNSDRVVEYHAEGTGDGFPIQTHLYDATYSGSRVTGFKEIRYYPISGNAYYIKVSEVSYDISGHVQDGYRVILSPKAASPRPNNEAIYQPTTVELSWRGGSTTTSFDIYFGTDTTPDENEFKGNQTQRIYDPGLLTNGTTYYWRVDANNKEGTTIGDIWSFTTITASLRKIIYVDADATGSNDGSSWIDAYNYLQNALYDANSAEKPVEVRVAQGIYKPDQGVGIAAGDRQATFLLLDGVSLTGGYAGIGEADPNSLDIETYETILSGDLNANDAETIDLQELQKEATRGENSYNVVTSKGNNSTSVLNGFTITAGNANGPRLGESPHYDYHLQRGGGMYNDGGSPTLNNCIFRGNSANYGSGMCNINYSYPMLINCTFCGNFASVQGAGIRNSRSAPMLNNCTFSDNLANNAGAGMHNWKSGPMLINCAFTGNSSGSGAGMENTFGSYVTLTNCNFTENSAQTSGGGVYNSGSRLTLTNGTFNRNFANNNGGGICNGSSNPNLTACIFSNNSANKEGGGMFNHGGSPVLTNCVFSSNFANENGGGMLNRINSYPIIINCTFSDNSASDIGGGIYNLMDSTITMINCILWNNTLEQIAVAISGNAIVTYSNIQGGWEGEGNIDANPLFTDETNGDYHLTVSSPCIGTGIMASSVPETDIEGNPRPNPTDSNPDMGAYENGLQSQLLKASNPIPADGAKTRQKTPILHWTPSYWAIEHDVYFGTDFGEVNEADSSDNSGIYQGQWPDTAYVTKELVGGVTYYWRIDEVNQADPNSPWKGDVWSFTVVEEMTVQYQVSSGDDDGYASSSNLQNLGGDYLKVGYSSFTQQPYYASGMIFRNVDVLQGAEIVRALLKVQSHNSRLTDTVYGTIEAEATNDAISFGAFRNIGTLPKTNASIDWDFNEPWAADTWYTSPDIASVIQEIIDRDGWSEGNSLAIIYSTKQDQGGYRNISSFNRGSDFAPILEITYIPR